MLTKKIILVKGMTCAACSSRVEKILNKSDGVESAFVNLASEKLIVNFDDSLISLEQIYQKIRQLGFDIYQDDNLEKIKNQKIKEEKNKLLNLKITLILAFILVFIAMTPMLTISQNWLPAIIHPDYNSLNFALIQILLVIPIMILGKEFYLVGFKSLLNKAPNMDSLIAIGTLSAFIYSLFNTLQIPNNPHATHMLYFESAGSIIALIKLGKFLEYRSKHKTSNAISKLLELAPSTAIIELNGQEVEIASEDIKINDIVIIKPGEKVSVDGMIIEGETSVDESMLTGESIPVTKKNGDSVFAATLNINGYIKVKTTKNNNETMLSQIIQLVEQAQSTKAPIAKLADIVSGYFVPSVILIATIAAIFWFLATKDMNFTIKIFVSVLVIACPCALGLATPTSIMVATGKGAENGILFKSADSLETIHKIDTVIFDKTGTITNGKPKVTHFYCSDFDESLLLGLLTSIEQLSEHPLASAIVKYGQEKNVQSFKIQNFKSLTGLGITGNFSNDQILVGNLKLMQQHNIDITKFKQQYLQLSNNGETVMFIAINNVLVGIISVADTIKNSAIEAINKLKELGITIYMITGDNQKTALAIAKQVNIENVIAEVLPDEKSNEVSKLQQAGKHVAFVGDGINDSISLTKADVGIAIASGTDIAIEASDVVIMHDNLLDIANAIKLGKATIRNIKENLFWAFCYNTLGIPVACGILYLFNGPLLNPMIAAAAMSLSSVSVVSNALRLKNFKPYKN